MPNGISVIIPTYNEEAFIAKAIDAILSELGAAKVPYEIIVADNCSTDNTASIVAKYPVTYLRCEKKGNPSATRNSGARLAKYELLCFIDGDCLVTPGWANRVIQAFVDPDVAAFGGPALSPANGNWIEKSWAATALKPYTHEYSSLPGANFCIRKSTFETLQGFDENLITAEDDDLSKRVINSGKKSIASSNHPVIHLGYPKTLLDIYKKQIWHGSSQLKAHGLLGDKMVTMTMLWGLSFVCLPIALAIHKLIAMVFLAVFLSCPLLIAIKRTSKFDVPKGPLITKAYLISFYFLAGRTVGLIKEAWTRG